MTRTPEAQLARTLTDLDWTQVWGTTRMAGFDAGPYRVHVTKYKYETTISVSSPGCGTVSISKKRGTRSLFRRIKRTGRELENVYYAELRKEQQFRLSEERQRTQCLIQKLKDSTL